MKHGNAKTSRSNVVRFPHLRAYPRIQMPGKVYIHDEARLFIAPLNNISAGGLFVSGLVAIPTGRTVRIVVKSEGFDAPIQARGTVVRVEKDARKGLAVAFTSISAAAKEFINQCVCVPELEQVA
ncbi:MAG: PilZ domain-containing protein [Deltaproteobacteria bacterium]|nr:PilZ domain-containing protein [Deltaproteobacteria bacterium]